MSLLGERVEVDVPGGSGQKLAGILLSGKRKRNSSIQKFVVRFKTGDMGTYRGDQLMLTGVQAEMDEYIKNGDVLFTKKTLGVCRYIGRISGYSGICILVEAIDPRLPNDTGIDFQNLLPDCNLRAQGSFTIIEDADEIKKVVAPENILGMLSSIKDKYVELVSGRAPGPPRQPRTVTFEPGRLGLSADWGSGVVENVVEGGQAEGLGVVSGWRIIEINGTPYTEQKLDAALEGQTPFQITFDAVSGSGGVAPNVVDLAQAGRREGGDASAPAGVSAGTLEELEQLRSEAAELREKFSAKEDELKIANHKISELMTDSEKLNTARSQVMRLRTSRSAYIDQIKTLEKEKASLTLAFEEKKAAHESVSQNLVKLDEEHHNLTLKYKKVKRRASKSMPRARSNMKIMRGNSGARNVEDSQDDEESNVLHDYTTLVSNRVSGSMPESNANAQSPGTPAEVAANNSGDDPKSINSTLEKQRAESPDSAPNSSKSEKKKGRGWFGRNKKAKN